MAYGKRLYGPSRRGRSRNDSSRYACSISDRYIELFEQ